MKFRPCIDIHNGKVKQIVGSTLTDFNNEAKENFVSEQDASYYGTLYRQLNLTKGHIILLNSIDSQYYEADCKQAKLALQAFPNGFQIGGGITEKNAAQFLDMGATHVIVTSFVFKDGMIHYDNLEKLLSVTKTKEATRLVLDLSCRKKGTDYYIVTDRWQKFTNVKLTVETLEQLSFYCDEFLIHAVDVEGTSSGIETELVSLLSKWNKLPITYAGGIGSFSDLQQLYEFSHGCIDVTIGSALDLFGGTLNFKEVLNYISQH